MAWTSARLEPLWIAQGADVLPDISESARIGVTQAAEATLRFFERSNPHVSGSRQLNR
jgi:3-methyladenine DNA glycosylase Mpg